MFPESAMQSQQQAGVGRYPAASSGINQSTAPKELGVLQRLEGVRGGLDEITIRLRCFIDRLSASGSKEDGSQPSPSGLIGNLAQSEERVRECIHLLGKLNDSF